jgi:hypothetical protein
MGIPFLLRLPASRNRIVLVPRPELSTRLATPEDAAAIATIYNEGIAERIATFETEPRTAEHIAKQLLEKGDRFPTVVAEHDGRVIAWAAPVPIELARRTMPPYKDDLSVGDRWAVIAYQHSLSGHVGAHATSEHPEMVGTKAHPEPRGEAFTGQWTTRDHRW